MSEERPKYGSLLIIDDHEIVQTWLKLQIGGLFRNIYHSATGEGGIAMAMELRPQLAFIDYQLPDLTGDAVVAALKKSCPELRILAYFFKVDEGSIRSMIEAGVHGFLEKGSDDRTVEEAVGRVLEGGEYFDNEIRKLMPQKRLEESGGRVIGDIVLSALEVKLIQLTCRKKSVREISRELGLSENVAERSQSEIFLRTDVKDAAGLLRFALQNQLINLDDL